MSLDCYPFESSSAIGLGEQPMALDVAYGDNLFISVTDQCQSIVAYDLSAPNSSNHIRKFSLGKETLVDQVKYCETGDYLACLVHKNGRLAVYIVLNWRHESEKLEISELDVNVEPKDLDRRDKLNSIDCCQKTGNIAASLGDLVIIYKYLGRGNVDANGATEDSLDEQAQHSPKDEKSIEECIESGLRIQDDESTNKNKFFEHIISIKLAIWSLNISLLENYLSITAVDHVQVLKLELLTLQIQSDVLDSEFADQQVADHEQANNSGSDPSNYTEGQSETTSTSTTIGTTCSMISDSNSTAATDVSLSNNNNNNNNGEQQLNNSDLSIITMNQKQQDGADYDPDFDDEQDQSADDCITWNLNTKKLVKLPTLMHNTSKNLSSYHICHPLELLGPASESIACRVSGSIYSSEFCQNQLELVVMLCKQFNFEMDPVKSTYLKAIYLSSNDDKRRLNKTSAQQQAQSEHEMAGDPPHSDSCPDEPPTLMESSQYHLLASVTCFVTTLTTCFVYTLHGDEVARTQIITFPDLCLDFRPDLLNAYLLTPMGLQICSTGACDSTFRYDWSSSSDLNLSFIATNGTRVLTSSEYVILVACSVNEHCKVEFMRKPSLGFLYNRIVYTVNRCNSISIRSNLLTYLHAMSHLALLCPQRSCGDGPEVESSDGQDTVDILKTATIMLCKQLLQKKQTNVITNSRIDKNIKHLLDISFCDLVELMRRQMEELRQQEERGNLVSSVSLRSLDNSCETDGPVSFRQMLRLSRAASEAPMHTYNPHSSSSSTDSNYELIKIYLKLAKFNQTLLNYLISNLANETVSKTVISYMFEHNPRLLIKCAQRIPMRLDKSLAGEGSGQRFGVLLVVEKLRLLAEFFSTGIDRATVLFTLASLYNTLDERQSCLSALGQIKPLNHLAITMSHNYELSQSLVEVVREHYPEGYSLFMDLVKRKRGRLEEA